MELALHFMNFTLPGGSEALGPTLAATAQAAEEAGCSTLTMMDHWFQMEGFATAQDPMLEGYTSLGFVAGKTERITLSLMVTGVTYRHPGLLAKIVTTLDVVSGGRAMLGLGAAWYEREHLALGVPFPPIAERFERLEETLQICNQMWSDNDGPYEGKHYHLAETICHPKPVQQPRPKILIGGGGERKTLKLVARYADACNLFALGPPEVKRKLDILARHCEAEGRDIATIKKTIQGAADPTKDLDGFLRDMEEYAKLGIAMVGVRNTSPDPVAMARKLKDVVPRLAQIGPS
ncbi:MAG: LLM class F420-dependent oxidoreductase [Candidatus Dormiibacterota bacterium]